MESVSAVVAVATSVVALAFVAYQTRIFARQTRYLAEQTALVTEQTRLSFGAGELSFNLAVMERLDGVLLQIAERPASHATIWSSERPDRPLQDNGVTHVLTQALVDVLEVALNASERLPGFSVNKADWESYAAYVAGPNAHSAVTRYEIQSQPEWWPTVARFLRSLDETPTVH